MARAKSKFLKVYFISLCTLSIFILLLSSCAITDNWVSTEEYEKLSSENEKLSDDYLKLVEEDKKLMDELKKELEVLKKSEEQQYKEQYLSLYPDYINILNENETLLDENINLEKEISLLEGQPQRLISLLEDLNNLLSNVYYGIAENENGYSFTAFAIEYDENNYIITAGHCINDNFGSSGLFKFKANFNDTWIYPELLAYEPYFWDLEDYAVFASEEIVGGLNIGDEPTDRTYVLGSVQKGLSVFRNIATSTKRGESGSPMINEFGEVLGILVIAGSDYTPIGLALERIDMALNND